MQHLTAIALLAAALAADAPVEKLATDFRFIEGPAFSLDGTLYFSDIPASIIYTLDPATGQTSPFRTESNRSNGLTFDADGRLYACEGGAKRVTRTEPDGAITVIADQYDGKALTGPNDLALDNRGGVWFSDPSFGKREDGAVEVDGVYRVTADGAITRVVDDLQRPNGLVFSADYAHLYVGDQLGDALWRYPVQPDGSLGEGEKLADLPGPDGMCIYPDDGTLYATAKDGVHVLTADGERLRIIELPEIPANCTLGPDGHLYVTAWHSVYRVTLTE